MIWIIRILLFLIFLFFLNLIRSYLMNLLSPSSSGSRPGRNRSARRKTISGQMVKDPQCGMYVATNLAVTARVRGETLHFCSENCRDNFVAGRG